MTKLYNKKTDDVPINAVYIGRGSKWGNPFIIGKYGTRKQVIEKYKKFLYSKPKLLEDVKKELKGKDLVCYCAPLSCHGDVLLEEANK
jgi:hypothetical protein